MIHFSFFKISLLPLSSQITMSSASDHSPLLHDSCCSACKNSLEVREKIQAVQEELRNLASQSSTFQQKFNNLSTITQSRIRYTEAMEVFASQRSLLEEKMKTLQDKEKKFRVCSKTSSSPSHPLPPSPLVLPPSAYHSVKRGEWTFVPTKERVSSPVVNTPIYRIVGIIQNPFAKEPVSSATGNQDATTSTIQRVEKKDDDENDLPPLIDTEEGVVEKKAQEA
jgi:hypothetical protein